LRAAIKTGRGSAECAAHTDSLIAARRERAFAKIKEFYDHCRADGERLCAEYVEKRPALVSCLNSQLPEVSDHCKKKLPKRGGYKGPGNAKWNDGFKPKNVELTPEQAAKKERLSKRKQAAAERRKKAEALRAKREEKLRKYKESLDEKAKAAQGESAADTPPAEPTS